ncbi:MAG: alpha/beta hydrolase [Gammaproteobacteria bacterium]|nr:alpha/beta hydrolase [Gammaproteobacteria bacterium]
MPFASRYIDIYYVETGEGPDRETELFIHGAGGKSTSWWQQMTVFAEHYHCLAHDHRGFGRSRCSPEAFQATHFAADALAVMDTAGVDGAHFVCQSMGGWTGVQMALEHPDRIKTLVLSDTIGGIALPSGLESIRTLGERVAALGAVSPALAFDYPKKDPAGAFLYLQLASFNTSHEDLDLNRKLFAADTLVPLTRCGELDLPILLISGSHDLIWPPPVLQELCGLLPDARIVEIDSGHSPYFENARAFNTELTEFLTSLD